jgi:formylglycine-generating enzyme required for sulfatase activity
VVEGVEYVAEGGLWEWCSSCRSFEHWNSLVPAWWSCDLEVDEQQLTALPTALEVAIQAQKAEDNLVAAARKAKAEITAGLSSPMDYEQL